MPEQTTDAGGELILQGIGVSPGVAVGEVVVFAQEGAAVPERTIREDEIPLEIARFEESLIKTRHQIAELQRKVAVELGEEHASIFDAHLLVVDDRFFVEEVIRHLREKR
ncbi:MAG: phosphoenolpyruvate-utilizing N-terminal domain-containing protein, partial [Kiritimatiellales bacterium]